MCTNCADHRRTARTRVGHRGRSQSDIEGRKSSVETTSERGSSSCHVRDFRGADALLSASECGHFLYIMRSGNCRSFPTICSGNVLQTASQLAIRIDRPGERLKPCRSRTPRAVTLQKRSTHKRVGTITTFPMRGKAGGCAVASSSPPMASESCRNGCVDSCGRRNSEHGRAGKLQTITEKPPGRT